MSTYAKALCALLVLAAGVEPACAQYQKKSDLSYPNHAIEVHVAPSYARLAYRLDEVRSKGLWDPSFGIGYQLQLNSFFTLAFSVDHRRYVSEIAFNGQHDSVDMDDGYGEKYFLHLVLNNTEKQIYQAIELSVRAQTTVLISSHIDWLFEVGVAYGIRFRERSEMTSGTIQKYAYFYEHHTLVDDLPSMNLGEYDGLINPMSGPLFRNSLLLRVGTGLRFRLTEQWGLNLIGTLHYGIPNIQAQKDVLNHHLSYSGVALSAIAGGVHPLSLGVEVGVFYRFAKPQGLTGRNPKKCWECPY